MALPFILLALAADRPDSGYGMKRRIDRELAPFWSAELSQIYPLLERLRRSGWLAESAAPPGRGPASRRFRTTAAGRRELSRWFLQPSRIEPVRDEALARFALRRGPGSGAAGALGDLERAVEEAIARERSRTGPGLAAAARDVALARLEGLRRWLRAEGAPDRGVGRRPSGKPRRRSAPKRK